MRKSPFGTQPQNLEDIIALESIPLEQQLPAKTTYEVMQNAAEKFGDKPALIFLPQGNAEEEPVVLSYAALFACGNQAANLFSSFDAKTISCLLPNIPQTVFSIIGAEAVGIVHPIRPDLSPEQIAGLMRRAKTDLLVTIGEFIAPFVWQNVLVARKLYPQLKTILVIGGKPDPANGIFDFDVELKKQPSQFTPKNISPKSVSAYFGTSATTSTHLKLVRLTHQSQIYAAWTMGTCFAYQESDCFAIGLPFFHVAAWTVGILTSAMCGATTVMMSPMGWMNPDVINNFWKIAEKYNVTVTAALNFMYYQLLPTMKNHSLRLAIAGTPVAAHVAAEYKNAGIQVVDIYGSTETMIATFNPTENAYAGSMGLRFPYEKTKVMSINADRECAFDEVGELWILGPNLTQGYQEDNQDAFHAGWFRTGDLVKQEQNGYFQFFDRMADVIQHQDGLISSLEIEKVFEHHPKIDRVAVIAQADSEFGEVPVLFATAKPNCDLTEDELRRWAIANISRESHRPAAFFIKDQFVLNGIAKVMKPILREEMSALNSYSMSP